MLKILNKEKIIEKFKIYLLPMLLGSAVAYDTINCYYYEKVRLYTLLFFVAEAVLFPLFDLIRKKKIIGGLVYTLMLVGVMYLATGFLRTGYEHSNVWFINWFYLDRDNAGFVKEYFYGLFVGGGFFLISVLYYFTVVRYRILGSMLCILFPFVICAKRADIMSELQITVLITLFLAVVVHNKQNSDGNVRTVVNLSYVISIALFVSFAGAVAMLVPKPSVTSVLERDSHAFDLDTSDSVDGGDYSSFSSTSSPRFGASYTNEILFYIESDYQMPVYYLKRQNYYGFYDDSWHVSSSTDTQSYYYYVNRTKITRKLRFDEMKSLAESGKYSEYGLTADKFGYESPTLYSFRVYDDDFNGQYIASPSGVVAESMANSAKKGYYSFGDGEVAVADTDRDYDYTISYYPETDEYVDFAENLGISSEDYLAILKEATDNGDLEDSVFYDEYEYVLDNYTGDADYSEEIAKLAEEITADCTNDYEKAEALCNYFEENDFVYDLEYTPDDTSIDYFLFESKTGSCTSYATAMTLMARACNLPARYVEGFAGYEHTQDGSVAVRDAHAHAFVEVFIPGAGWITFDPTVSGYMADYSQTSGFDFSVFAKYFSRIVIFLGVIFFVVFILMLDRIAEVIFRIRIKFVKGDRRIVLLYGHIVRLLEFSSRDDLSAYTVKMLTEYVLAERGVSIERTAKLFEKTAFGMIPMTEQEFAEAYGEYRAVYGKLRKLGVRN